MRLGQKPSLQVDASKEYTMVRIQRICEPIPLTVDLGIHVGYGVFGAKHILEPVDAARMIVVANALAASIKRLTYIHFPIPMAGTRNATRARSRTCAWRLKLASIWDWYISQYSRR